MLNGENLSSIFAQLPRIEKLSLSPHIARNISIDILRLDNLHSAISGNKWFKLKYHLQSATLAKKTEVLSFGGAYSNHLHALAYVGYQLKFKTIGFVRGELSGPLNSTLADCKRWGMSLHWLDRQTYRRLATEQGSASFVSEYPDAWVIPEGGEGKSGVRGVKELFSALCLGNTYDLVVCSVGSGTTMAGIVEGLSGREGEGSGSQVLGFSALKGATDLDARVKRHLSSSSSELWSICHDYHFGGFAKVNALLLEFISVVHAQSGIWLDPVYTGKALFGLLDLLDKGLCKQVSRILFVHTGGLQGWRGFPGEGPAVRDGKDRFS